MGGVVYDGILVDRTEEYIIEEIIAEAEALCKVTLGMDTSFHVEEWPDISADQDAAEIHLALDEVDFDSAMFRCGLDTLRERADQLTDINNFNASPRPW